jgi:hypothetical protein
MKLYSLIIRGKYREWTFPILAKPEWVEDWRNDNLNVDEIINTIPQWYVDLGLPVKLWCFIQDIFRR